MQVIDTEWWYLEQERRHAEAPNQCTGAKDRDPSCQNRFIAQEILALDLASAGRCIRDAEVCRKKEEFEREIDAVEPLLDVKILKPKLYNRTFTNINIA